MSYYFWLGSEAEPYDVSDLLPKELLKGLTLNQIRALLGVYA